MYNNNNNNNNNNNDNKKKKKKRESVSTYFLFKCNVKCIFILAPKPSKSDIFHTVF